MSRVALLGSTLRSPADPYATLQVYLTTLEWTKSEVGKAVGEMGVTGPAAAGLANFAGGALASLATQSVTVPIDVISQKQIVHGDETVVARHQQHRVPGQAAARPAAAAPVGQGKPAAAQPASSPAAAATAAAPSGAVDAASAAARSPGAASTSGRPAGAAAAQGASETAAAAVVRRIGPVQMVRLIIKEEGLAGLYRGFLPSVATFVPSSAVWWGAYGAYQKMIWSLLSDSGSGPAESDGELQHRPHTTGTVVGVQTASSVLAGCTSSIVTTPLDLIKVGHSGRNERRYMHTAQGCNICEQLSRRGEGTRR